MILLDDRVGSRELLRYFRPFDVVVDSIRLESGDACFPGNGPDGLVMIGVERKRISDFVQSMRQRRLAGKQIPGMMSAYDYVYVIVEGVYRPGDRGGLEEYRGGGWRDMGLRYREVSSHLSTLELKCGVIVKRTSSPMETAITLVDLYKWWNEKEWKQHHSHLTIYNPSPDALITTRKARYVSVEETIRRKYGDEGVVCWKWAASLPGIDAKAELVVEKFRRPGVMAAAKEKDWVTIPGIGKTLAKRFVEICKK